MVTQTNYNIISLLIKYLSCIFALGLSVSILYQSCANITVDLAISLMLYHPLPLQKKLKTVRVSEQWQVTHDCEVTGIFNIVEWKMEWVYSTQNFADVLRVVHKPLIPSVWYRIINGYRGKGHASHHSFVSSFFRDWVSRLNMRMLSPVTWKRAKLIFNGRCQGSSHNKNKCVWYRKDVRAHTESLRQLWRWFMALTPRSAPLGNRTPAEK